MENIFDTQTLESVRHRLGQLFENSDREWGKMSPAQMLHHCQAPLNIVLGKNMYDLRPNWFARTFFKKSMYSDKLWKKNMPTLKSFRESEDRDFETERNELLGLLDEIDSRKDEAEWPIHPVFGELTKEQWGKMQYKHLDHHLRQFGL